MTYDPEQHLDEWSDILGNVSEEDDSVEIGKKGRRSKKKSVSQPTIPQSITPEEITDTVSLPLTKVCELFGVSEPSETELSRFGRGVAPCVNKYTPTLARYYGAEFLAAFTVAALVLPRVVEYQKNQKENEDDTVTVEATEEF